MSFRKDVILRLGGFDTRFGGTAFLEETDFCIRLRKAGYKMVFDNNAELIHLKEPTGGCRSINWRSWFYWYGHNYALLYAKNSKTIIHFAVFKIRDLLLSAIKRRNAILFIEGLRGLKEGFFKAKKNSLF